MANHDSRRPSPPSLRRRIVGKRWPPPPAPLSLHPRVVPTDRPKVARYGARTRAPHGIPLRYPILLVATLVGIALFWMSVLSGRLQLVGRLPDYPRGTLHESRQDMSIDIASWETADSLADIRAFYYSRARCTDILVTTELVTLRCVRTTETKEAIITTVAAITARVVGPQRVDLRVEQSLQVRGKGFRMG